MVCQQCGTAGDTGDNYCRVCGNATRRSVVRMIRNDAAPGLPLGLNQPALWRGVAALALGTAAELLRRWLNQRLVAPARQDMTSLSPTSVLADLVERRLLPADRPSERDLVVEEELHIRYVRAGKRR